MKIAAITMVYNEELILPFFLRHYEYLNEIHVLYETDSTDNTLAILNSTPNVIVHKCHIEDGLDDIDKVSLINDMLQGIKADWVYVIDSDEFIFPLDETPEDFLGRQNYDIIRAAMFQVYRHRTEKDLDVSLPPVHQRIHGDPDVFSTVDKPNRTSNFLYVKPIVVRPSAGLRFLPGSHFVEGSLKISPEFYIGAHWQMADPLIAIARRMQCRARISERNKSQGMGSQHWNVTEEWIREECDTHLDDPVIDVLYQAIGNGPEEKRDLSGRAVIQEAVIIDFRNLVRARDSQIQALNYNIQQLEAKLLEIDRSITWRFAQHIHRMVETLFPPKTRRRLIVNRILSTFREK